MRKAPPNKWLRLLPTGVSLLLVFLLLLTACGSLNAGPLPTPTPSFATQADAYLTQLVAEQAFSGVVQVAEGGKVLFSKSYGMADWQNHVPTTLNTKFRIGSVTKQFTAMAILILQEQGKLHVQDHLCTYLAQCPSAWQPVTLHELLTHTAGIPVLKNLPSALPATPEEVIALYNHVPLDFPPGTQFEYSNEGYQVLGYVIQRVSDQSYASFIQQQILAPLHMNDSGFYLPAGQSIAQGYQAWQTAAAPLNSGIPLPANYSFLYANGYLYSTVGDLQRWDQSLTAPTLVSQQSLKAMFTPYVAVTTYMGNSHYGYGWVIDQELSPPVIWHDGRVTGYRAYNGWYPDRKATIIILDNLDTANPDPIAINLQSMLFNNR